ncbi:hypothetical protein GIB67_029931 [Kingdonia uniflora]|uniref:Cytochrome P450 n=1 Tax=Kingdonia uniflora TaxID=39325 RepID=A0A7J7MXQ7_9MAGN|nr:hypothetical protein GIB67_029931 [Kingdonia uniflora]
MVVKESMRLHPVMPLLLPHELMEDCTVQGFHITKKSRIIVNSWAIGRDPSVWTEPAKFLPERFIKNNVDYRGREFQLLSFGSGRRGVQLGLTIVSLVLAQLVHCFEWFVAVRLRHGRGIWPHNAKGSSFICCAKSTTSAILTLKREKKSIYYLEL